MRPVRGRPATPRVVGLLSQGGESNLNGSWLENVVLGLARERNVPIVSYSLDRDNRDFFHPILLICRVPYKNIYGAESRSEFVLQFHERRIRIECRMQETTGSVDEKFPYLFLNARDQMPEHEVVLVLYGNGARPHAVDWLRTRCAAVQTKTIQVFDIDAYRSWFKGLWPKSMGRTGESHR